MSVTCKSSTSGIFVDQKEDQPIAAVPDHNILCANIISNFFSVITNSSGWKTTSNHSDGMLNSYSQR